MSIARFRDILQQWKHQREAEMSTVVIQLEFQDVVTKEELYEFIQFLIENNKLEYSQYTQHENNSSRKEF